MPLGKKIERQADFCFKPTDSFSARFTLSNNEKKSYFFDGAATNGTVDIKDITRSMAKHANFDMDTKEKTDLNSQSLVLSYEADSFKVDSTTTNKKFKLRSVYDSDFIANTNSDGLAQYNYTDSKVMSQELRFASKDQEIRWVVGLYFDKEDRDQGPYGVNQWADMSAMGMGTGVYRGNAIFTSKAQTHAVFGQTMIPVQSFELTLGGRYQTVKKEIDLVTKQSFNGASFPDVIYKDDKKWNIFLPKVALSYKPNDDATTYVSISKGYMPGGLISMRCQATKSKIDLIRSIQQATRLERSS